MLYKRAWDTDLEYSELSHFLLRPQPHCHLRNKQPKTLKILISQYLPVKRPEWGLNYRELEMELSSVITLAKF